MMLWTAPPPALRCHGRRGVTDSEVWAMQAVTTIGLDIAKSIFQVHGVDAEGNVAVRRKLKRRYVVAFFQDRGFSLRLLAGPGGKGVLLA